MADYSNFKDLIIQYREVIRTKLIPSHVCHYLMDFVSEDMRSELLNKERKGSRPEAVDLLLDKLIREDKPAFYHVFMNGLKEAKFEVIVRILEGHVNVKHQEMFNRLVNAYLPDLVTVERTFSPTKLIPYLKQLGCITERDAEEIRRLEQNESPYLAALVLLQEYLASRHEDWFSHFLYALKNAGDDHLCKLFDPELDKAKGSLESMQVFTERMKFEYDEDNIGKEYEPGMKPSKHVVKSHCDGETSMRMQQQVVASQPQLSQPRVASIAPTLVHREQMTPAASGVACELSGSMRHHELAFSSLPEQSVPLQHANMPRMQRMAPVNDNYDITMLKAKVNDLDVAAPLYGTDDSNLAMGRDKVMEDKILNIPPPSKQIHQDRLGTQSDEQLILNNISIKTLVLKSELVPACSDDHQIEPAQWNYFSQDRLLTALRELGMTKAVTVSVSRSPDGLELVLSGLKPQDAGVMLDAYRTTKLASKLEQILLCVEIVGTDRKRDDYKLAVELSQEVEESLARLALTTKPVCPRGADSILRLSQEQQRLTEAAQDGKNCVILSPTDSHREIVVSIVKGHLSAAHGCASLAQRRVVIVVDSLSHLQLYSHALMVYLPDVKQLTIRPEDIMFPLISLQQYEVIVVTSSWLSKADAGGDGVSSLFSLIVVVRCHLATVSGNGHHNIMTAYLERKEDASWRGLMPQVVGVTCPRVAVGQARRLETATKSLLNLAASLDAVALCWTPQHGASMMKSEGKGQQTQEARRLPGRQEDTFQDELFQLMTQIEEYMRTETESASLSRGDERCDVSVLVAPPAGARRGSRRYTEWLGEVRRTLGKLRYAPADTRRALTSCVDQLTHYSNAVQVNSACRGMDALDHLTTKLNTLSGEGSKDGWINRLFKEKAQHLHEITIAEHPNPALSAVREALLPLLAPGSRQQCMVVVPSLPIAASIISWLEKDAHLRSLQPQKLSGRLGAGSRGAPSVVSLSRHFPSGDCRLLVAHAPDGLADVGNHGDDLMVLQYGFSDDLTATLKVTGSVSAPSVPSDHRYVPVSRAEQTESAPPGETAVYEHVVADTLQRAATYITRDLSTAEFNRRVNNIQNMVMRNRETKRTKVEKINVNYGPEKVLATGNYDQQSENNQMQAMNHPQLPGPHEGGNYKPQSVSFQQSVRYQQQSGIHAQQPGNFPQRVVNQPQVPHQGGHYTQPVVNYGQQSVNYGEQSVNYLQQSGNLHQQAVNQLQLPENYQNQGENFPINQRVHASQLGACRQEQPLSLHMPDITDDFELRCRGCNRLVTMATHLRRIPDTEYVVVVDEEFSQRVMKAYESEQETKDGLVCRTGKVLCNYINPGAGTECYKEWGVMALYKSIQFAFLKPKNLVIVKGSERRKKWTWQDTPFVVAPLDTHNMQQYQYLLV